MAPEIRLFVAARTWRRLSLITAALLALLVPLMAGPTRAQAGPEAQHSMAVDVLRLLNDERHAHHLPPLTMRTALRVSAHRHNMAMAARNTLAHQLPREAFFAERIAATGYRWTSAGENIAWDSELTVAGALAVQRQMYNEKAPDDGHRVNILSPGFRDVGVDVLIDQAHHKVWLTTDFGSR